MKKTMTLLLGVLLASVLPGSGLKAQSTKYLQVRVNTLNRASLDSVFIFQATSSDQMLCVASKLDAGYSGTATNIHELTFKQPLQRSVEDSFLFFNAAISPSSYTNPIIMAVDADSNYYILGNAISAEMRDTGVFRPANASLLDVEGDTIPLVTLGYDYMLNQLRTPTYLRDNTFRYTTVEKAVANTTDQIIRLTADYPTAGTINRSIIFDLGSESTHYLFQNTLTLTNSDGPVTLRYGSLGTVLSSSTGTGLIALVDLDSVNTLILGNNHPVEVYSCRVRSIPVLNDNLTVYTGKFNQQIPGGNLAPRRACVANSDADRTSFAYTVVEGYNVTFVNYDGRGTDSSIVVNTEDNTIPEALVPARPAYTGNDTLFGLYWIDNAYTNRWVFAQDVLSQDTTLYAKWSVFNALTDYRYTVNHLKIGLNAVDTLLADSEQAVAAQNATVAIRAFSYEGFSSQVGLSMLVSLTSNDTVFNIYYVRDTFDFVLNFNGATFDSTAIDTLQRLEYGAPITLPTPRSDFEKPGYRFVGWLAAVDGVIVSVPDSMPAGNLVVAAQFAENYYTVSWRGRDTVIYAATDYGSERTPLVYCTDDPSYIVPDSLILLYVNNVPNGQAINAGDYTIGFAVTDARYNRLSGYYETNLHIRKRPVTLSNLMVDTVKFYDGNQNARVDVTNVTVDNLCPADTLMVSSAAVSARHNDSEIGTGKVVTVYYDSASLLAGAARNNYYINPSWVIYSNNGAILERIVINDSLFSDGFDIDVKGYCAGTSLIEFHLLSGQVDEYKLDFSDEALAQGFSNVDWTATPQDGFIAVDVLDGTFPKPYEVTVTFRNSEHVQYGENFTSVPATINFRVNFPEDVIRPMFPTVITIINDTTHYVIDTASIRWYHSADGVNDWREVGSGPFHQQRVNDDQNGDPEELSGAYLATFEYSDLEGNTYTYAGNDYGWTCVQTSLGADNYPTSSTIEATVTARPNPVVDRVVIRIDNSEQFSHTVRVMNIMGVTLHNGTFDGNETTLDFSRFGHGSYTVSIDGIVVRVIKK